MDWFLFAFPVATVCSTMVFHCPHAGHFPIHFGLSFPQLVQNHTVFSFVAIFVPLSAAKIAIFVYVHKKSSILSYLKVPQFICAPHIGRTGLPSWKLLSYFSSS